MESTLETSGQTLAGVRVKKNRKKALDGFYFSCVEYFYRLDNLIREKLLQQIVRGGLIMYEMDFKV